MMMMKQYWCRPYGCAVELPLLRHVRDLHGRYLRVLLIDLLLHRGNLALEHIDSDAR